MDIKQRIKALLKEAEVYRSQGLLVEAKGKYAEVASEIKKNDQIKNKQTLIEGIHKKIKSIEVDLNKLVKAPSTVEVPKEVQELIKKQFVLAKDMDEDSAALEGAIALAKFGQYESAIQEFNQLIEKESVKVAAAKNILRCHITHTSLDDAVNQYENWFATDIFTPDQINNLRQFLEDVLNKKGSTLTLSQVEETPSLEKEKQLVDEEPEEEMIDISSVKITFEDGPRKGETIDFDVNFQSGNVISLLFSYREKDLVESFRVGLGLNNLQFFSPIAIFMGTGVVAEKTEISSGPRRGDYSIDIRIVSTN